MCTAIGHFAETFDHEKLLLLTELPTPNRSGLTANMFDGISFTLVYGSPRRTSLGWAYWLKISNPYITKARCMLITIQIEHRLLTALNDGSVGMTVWIVGAGNITLSRKRDSNESYRMLGRLIPQAIQCSGNPNGRWHPIQCQQMYFLVGRFLLQWLRYQIGKPIFPRTN